MAELNLTKEKILMINLIVSPLIPVMSDNPSAHITVSVSELACDWLTLYAENSRLTKGIRDAMEEIEKNKQMVFKGVEYNSTDIVETLEIALDILRKHCELKEGSNDAPMS